MHQHESERAAAIDRLLPQTQCEQCGYRGCLPYATAIADGAPINRCPPGGPDTIRALAGLLGREEVPLDGTLAPHPGPTVAVIDEARCIGCALCLPVCPVDAIVGAPRWMHTVVEDWCTGCGLCLPPCPVDCIELVPAAAAPHPDRARERHRRHQARADSVATAAEVRRRARKLRRHAAR